MISTKNRQLPHSSNTDIAEELSRATLLGISKRGKLSLYTFDGAHLPRLMNHICRLRDEAFATVGVTMNDSHKPDPGDIDGTYRQLIVYNPLTRSIAGGYRYAVGSSTSPEQLSLWRYFRPSQRFIEEYLPYGIELGRTFVSHPQQLHALDSLWEGLAMIINAHNAKYLFGRVTLYPSLGIRATNLLIGFMRHAFGLGDRLMEAHTPIKVGISRHRFRHLFNGTTPQENYRILLSRMRTMRRTIPPIISSYMRLSPSMQTFDAYKNNDLGGVTEAAIMLTIDDIYDDIKRRYFY